MSISQYIIDKIAKDEMASLSEERQMDFEIWKTDKIKMLDRKNIPLEESNLFLMWMIETE